VKFLVSHEVLYRTTVEAPNEKEAALAAENLAYDEWDRSVITREDVVPMEESPVNPQAGG
jgi:hypothetical protein